MACPLIARLTEAADRVVEAARATVLPVHPLQIDVLKLIACICMLIDHINTCLYDRASIWAWLIGRLAFPLFALTFVLTLKAHKAMDTSKRLFIWAICTQPVYALAFANTGFSPWWAGNILFSFAAVAYLVGLSQALSAANVAKGLVLFFIVSIIQAPSSFGAVGLIFMFALHRVTQDVPRRAALWAVGTALALVGLNPNLQQAPYALMGSLLSMVWGSKLLRHRTHKRASYGSWSLWLYGGHQLALVVIQMANSTVRS